jgi:hypothetical protein
LSEIETAILIALALQLKPGSFSELRSQVATSISNYLLLEGLNSLELRSLLEIKDGQLSLLPLLASYVKEQCAIGEMQ